MLTPEVRDAAVWSPARKLSQLQHHVARVGKRNVFGASVFAALTLAFASFGDAFLYAFLPVNFNAVSLPVVWVGFLLSVNRFVRIFSNTIVVYLFGLLGVRALMITGVVLAVASTLGYGVAAGVTAWVFLRTCWGLAFSVLRIGTLEYALKEDQVGFALGMSKSIQEGGPMVSLFVAPILLQYFDTHFVFFVLAALSCPAIFFALQLPAVSEKMSRVPFRWSLRWPSTFNSITLLSAILIDGIFVLVLGVLFLEHRDGITLAGATTLAAFYLAFRRTCLVVLSPAGGWIADRIGFSRVFRASMALIIAGLLAVLSGHIEAGAAIIFIFHAVNSAVTPGSVGTDSEHPLAAVAENATWRDVGAATGTLLGGVLIDSQYRDVVIMTSTTGLTIFFLLHLGSLQAAKKILARS